MTTEELLKQQQTTDEENNSAVQAYKRNNLHIESKIKLVEALYEGLLRFNSNLIKAIEENDVEAKVEWANKSSSIFIELMNALDMDSEGTIAQYLHGLYSQQLRYLFEANRDNDIEKVELVNKVVRGLLEAWREVAFEQK